MNDVKFWDDYLIKLKNAIIDLSKEKGYVKVDLHMHSNYSADGKQSVSDILKNTKEKGFDIIAITDHDTLDVYDELYDIVKDGLTSPLIIPGIEFTLDNREYGNQFHMLQLFVNPKNEDILNDVIKAKDAMFNRSKIQFKRIDDNKALQKIFNDNDIVVSYDEYVNYLSNNKLVPEYDTICAYLLNKLTSKGINTFDVLNALEIANNEDIYEDRKEYKSRRYSKLREKYEVNDDNKNSVRFLISMLAVREVDDDWWDAPSSGSLSVNSYGQPRIEDLNTTFRCCFAHPEEKKLDVVKKILDDNQNIIALEQNIRSSYEDINNFNNLVTSRNLIRLVGSDTHDSLMKFYSDMDYYKIDINNIIDFINKC